MSTYRLTFAGPAPDETRRKVLEQLRSEKGRRIFRVVAEAGRTVTIETVQEETAEQQEQRLFAWAECRRAFAESTFWQSLSIELAEDLAVRDQLELFEVAP
jgi:hypothetical protein